jgi:hypothetical protein
MLHCRHLTEQLKEFIKNINAGQEELKKGHKHWPKRTA